MRRPAFALDGALCALAGLFYLVNHFLLSPALAGTAAGWFLSCYANDMFAGLAICAWADPWDFLAYQAGGLLWLLCAQRHLR